MTVYIVTYEHLSDEALCGVDKVFATRESAVEYVQSRKDDKWHAYIIEQWEVET